MQQDVGRRYPEHHVLERSHATWPLWNCAGEKGQDALLPSDTRQARKSLKPVNRRRCLEWPDEMTLLGDYFFQRGADLSSQASLQVKMNLHHGVDRKYPKPYDWQAIFLRIQSRRAVDRR